MLITFFKKNLYKIYMKYNKYNNMYNPIIKYIKIKYKTRSKKIIRKNTQDLNFNVIVEK
jgi:hypothetical protein